MTESKKAISQNHYMRFLESGKISGKDEEGNDRVLSATEQQNCEFGHALHKKAQFLYPGGIEPSEGLSFQERLIQSKALLKAEIPLFEPMFEYERASAQVDILVPLDGGGWELVEVKGAKNIVEDWVKYTAFEYFVCVKAGIKIEKVIMLHLKGYVNDVETAQIEEIFDKTDITAKVVSYQEEIEEEINVMREQALKKERKQCVNHSMDI